MKRKPPSGAPRLIGVRDDARIEQRGRLERILVQEVGADQLALSLVNGACAGESILHFVGPRLEGGEQVTVAALEILEHIGELAAAAGASSASTRSTIWLARVLSVGLRSRGSVAGLNGLTMTRAGSGRR